MSDRDTAHAALEKMNAMVMNNAATDFGGCFVIAPPGEGEPQTLLVLDNATNPAVFWSLLQTRASMALAELESERNSPMGVFGRR